MAVYFFWEKVRAYGGSCFLAEGLSVGSMYGEMSIVVMQHWKTIWNKIWIFLRTTQYRAIYRAESAEGMQKCLVCDVL